VVEKLEGGVTTDQLEALMREHSSEEESDA
jgi:hypothetical protein